MSIVEALRLRYPLPSYALFFEVRNTTGSARVERYADAIAVGCWPSRGLDVIGMEFKADRRDWLREWKEPAKAEAFVKFCDYWFVVQSEPDIVKLEELPKTWGLLTLRGERLVTTVDAPKLEPIPMTRGFLASLLRNSLEQSTEKVIRQESYDKGWAEGRQDLVDADRTEQENLRREIERLKEIVASFEKATAIAPITQWNAERVAAAVEKHLAKHDIDGALRGALLDAEKAVASIRAALEK